MTNEETLNYVLPAGKVLVLRTSDNDRTSYGGFQWPESGYVEADDYKPTKLCGNGLHGALKGEGDGGLFDWDEDAVWQVVEVDDNDEIIDLRGKVKFRCGNVIYSGNRRTATNLVSRIYGGAIIGATVTGGDESTVTGGDGATVTGGDGATVTGGDWATVTGGNWATVTGGCGAILQLKWHDGQRYRIATAYVGEDGIKANTAYRINGGKFVEAS